MSSICRTETIILPSISCTWGQIVWRCKQLSWYLLSLSLLLPRAHHAGVILWVRLPRTYDMFLNSDNYCTSPWSADTRSLALKELNIFRFQPQGYDDEGFRLLFQWLFNDMFLNNNYRMSPLSTDTKSQVSNELNIFRFQVKVYEDKGFHLLFQWLQLQLI